MTAQAGRRTQAERRTATRSALVRATVDSLVELGYARTTTQEVQSRAGLSRGALTHHFTTKAELVLAAMDHLYEEFSESVRKAAVALPDDPTARIRLGVELIWERFDGPRAPTPSCGPPSFRTSGGSARSCASCRSRCSASGWPVIPRRRPSTRCCSPRCAGRR
jgi:AcrR family transcriptional regulator